MVGTRFFGRMGNVLFQSANMIALALRYNQEFSVPNRTTNPFWNPLYLQHLVHPDWKQGVEDILINEHKHSWQPIEWKDEWKDKQVVLNGYWQSEKYFSEYRSEILYLFGFPYEKKEGLVSVHVRRGDYLTLPEKHPPVPKEWYEMVMKKFVGYKFKFFSDDIKWCRETFGDRNDVEFSSNSDEVSDLIDASHCEHNISSASTFSWWISYLNRNENKAVYVPKLWFVEGYHLDTTDIIPNWMQKI